MADKQSILEFVGDVVNQQNIKFKKGSVTIKAMDAGIILSTLQKLKDFGDSLSGQGVTWKNYQDQEQIIKVAFTLANDFSSLLSDVTNIVEADLKALPPEILLQIVQATLEVNAKSKDVLIKNWLSLVESGKKTGLVATTEVKQTSENSSKS